MVVNHIYHYYKIVVFLNILMQLNNSLYLVHNIFLHKNILMIYHHLSNLYFHNS